MKQKKIRDHLPLRNLFPISQHFFRESGEKSSKKKCFRGCQYSSFKNPSVFPGFNYKAYTTTTGHDNQIKIQTFKWCLRQMSDGDLY